MRKKRDKKVPRSKGPKLSSTVVSTTATPAPSVKVSRPSPSTRNKSSSIKANSTTTRNKKQASQRRKRNRRTSAVDPYGFFNIRTSFKKGGPC